MAEEVIKDNGTKEPFEAEKIRDSVEEAAEGAGLADEEAESLAEEIGARAVVMAEEKTIIPTSAIRDFVLQELDKEAPEVAKAWRRYEKRKE